MTVIPKPLVDEILDAAETPGRARAMLEALRRRLERIERWPGPYVSSRDEEGDGS